MSDNIIILVVDDDDDMRAANARVAARTGCRVLQAGTGEEALRLVREERPDLILLDNNLPDTGGSEISRRLKTDPATASIYIAMLSASRTTSDNKIEGLESGADEYLVQPIPPQELLSRLRAMLRILRAEKKLQALLRDKDVLMREINHRAKNNFVLISSLLDMQAGEISDPAARAALKGSRDRIATMALIHERLYRFPDLTSVGMRGFLGDLAGSLWSSMAPDPRAAGLHLDLDDLHLPVDQAIHCGLLVNELLTNALKHGAPAASGGPVFEVEVGLKPREDGRLRLWVANTGSVLPKDFSFRRAGSLGLTLVRILAEDQLGGELEVSTSPRTEFGIVFRPEETEPAVPPIRVR